LPKDIRYLCIEEYALEEIDDFEPLQEWTQLRFLRISGTPDSVFDARCLSRNRLLRRLELSNWTVEHPEALSQLERLESLSMTHIPNLATAAFANGLPHLQSVDLTDTAVWNLLGLKHPGLVRLNVSDTKVRHLEFVAAENIEELNISGTMVRDLSPLSRQKNLRTVTATLSTVERLPSDPMPLLRVLTLLSTPVSAASIEEFSRRNPRCVVMARWPDSLRAATAEATRLRVRSGGPGAVPNHEMLWFFEPTNTLLDIRDAAAVQDFMRLIDIDDKNSDDGCLDGCCLESGPTFELYRHDRLLVTLGWVNLGHAGLCWSRHWPMLNARLTNRSAEQMAGWLADHGCPSVQAGLKKGAAEKNRVTEQRHSRE